MLSTNGEDAVNFSFRSLERLKLYAEIIITKLLHAYIAEGRFDEEPTLETSALISNSLWWLSYIIYSVDKTKLSSRETKR